MGAIALGAASWELVGFPDEVKQFDLGRAETGLAQDTVIEIHDRCRIMDDVVVRAVNIVIGGQDSRASTAHHGGRNPAFRVVLHMRGNAEHIGMKQRGLPWRLLEDVRGCKRL